MDVVAHEHVGMDSYAIAPCGFAEQVVIVSSVNIVHEYGAAINATLDDVQGCTWKFESGASRHVLIVTPAP